MKNVDLKEPLVAQLHFILYIFSYRMRVCIDLFSYHLDLNYTIQHKSSEMGLPDVASLAPIHTIYSTFFFQIIQ